MKKLLLLLMVMALCGCANAPTVHLNTLYLDKETATKLEEKLSERGLNVEVSQFSFPEGVTSTSLIYAPLLNDQNAIEQISASLKELNLDLSSESSLVLANHWYVKNNIGLYVVPGSVTVNSRRSVSELSGRYQSEKCKTPIAMELNKNGEFQYFEASELIHTGQWSIADYPYIILENEKPYIRFFYEIEKFVSKDKVGTANLTALKPLSSGYRIIACEMVTGVRR